jgi:RNA polymerase sigma-70 factor (family 1)
MGDEAAFRILYDQYEDKLYGFLFNLTKSHSVSEDLLQDTFMKIWEDREQLEKITDFRAYLFTMVKHRALNAIRRISKEELILQKISQRSRSGEMSTETAVYYNDLRRKIDWIIRQLPPQQRLVYRLSREEGLKQEEISHRLKITVATVKKHLTLSLRYIRKSLSLFIFCLLFLGK